MSVSAIAVVLATSHLNAALEQSWPPFVLVTGLLLIGLVAGRDGLFDAAASRLVALPGPPVLLLGACLALVAVVTALLNLDTAVVFLTPVLIRTAQRRGLAIDAFLYGAIFMANASSLFLPGSNLTNLLVLSGTHVSGGRFFTQMLPAAFAAALLTAAGLLWLHRRSLRVGSRPPLDQAVLAIPVGAALAAAVLAAVAMVVLRNAALPVLAIATALVLWRARGGSLGLKESVRSIGAPALVGLFALSVTLGTIARAAGGVGLGSSGRVVTTVVAALASVVVNNLPAAALLTSSHGVHADALLYGLNIGPNLAVTGSLAALLWWRAAIASGVRPSVISYSRQGLLLAPLALAGALAVGGA